MLRRTASRSVRTSWPATRALPAVGRASVQRMLMVVDLPAPFGPRKPKVSPGSTRKSTPRTASTSPYRFSRPDDLDGRRALLNHGDIPPLDFPSVNLI